MIDVFIFFFCLRQVVVFLTNEDITVDLSIQQLANEQYFGKSHMVEQIKDNYIRDGFEPHVEAYYQKVFNHLLNTNYHYDTKTEKNKLWVTKLERHRDLLDIDLYELCWEIVVFATMKPTSTYTEVVGKLFKKLGKSSIRQGIENASELLALLNQTPFINVVYPKYAEEGVLMIHSNIQLDDAMVNILNNKRFDPPMIVPPEKVRSNSEIGYQSINKSVILGGKHHDYPIALDHINRQNQVPYRLETRLFRMVDDVFEEKEEERKDKREKRYKQWQQLKRECGKLYGEIISTGNELYFAHRYCERGRTHIHGFHFNPQGDSYRKAIIEFKQKVMVEVC